MKRALCVWLPNWPLQRLAAARGELKDRAVLLYELHSSGSARVTHACARLADAATAWQQAGIRPGMPLAEATALAGLQTGEDGSPGEPLHLEMADPLADRVALEELAAWCQRFSPSVGLDDGDEPEGLLLDITGLGPLVGGDETLARQVVAAFHARGLRARVAIADTLGAAWAVAHFAELNELAPRGCGLRVVPPGKTWAAIAPLEVEALRLPDETCEVLAQLGLRRVEQVAALPRGTLLARFGPLVLDKLDRATGAAAEAIVARAAPEELALEQLFEHPTTHAERIEGTLTELIGRACQSLGEGRRGMLRLECRFEYEQGAGENAGDQVGESFIVGLYRPAAAPRYVAELARLKLERVRFRRPVAAVGVRVLAVDRLEFRQQQMEFAEPAALRRESPRELAVLVDRLSNRLGAQAVVRPWLLAAAQPEFACQYKPMASLAPRRGGKKNRAGRGAAQAAKPARVPGDRPLYLESSPRPLAVVSIAPEGPPMQFRLAGRDERIVQAWGPERIETSWWRSRCVRRDYYQVETASGERYWLYRQLNTGRWFLHGWFG